MVVKGQTHLVCSSIKIKNSLHAYILHQREEKLAEIGVMRRGTLGGQG